MEFVSTKINLKHYIQQIVSPGHCSAYLLKLYIQRNFFKGTSKRDVGRTNMASDCDSKTIRVMKFSGMKAVQ